MEMTTSNLWVALVVGILPLVGWLLWWWNDFWYALPMMINLRRHSSGGGAKLPPGYMGIPFFGEMLNFLWYFKFLSRPDDFINSKRQRYGDGEGLYRTHLFGSSAIIACTPSSNKFILQTESSFHMDWPSVEIVGATSLVAVHGASHTREAKKVTFANIGMFFASIEPGPVLDTLDVLFVNLLAGVRAYPLNFPGTAFHRALKSRKMAVAIFREKMEKRKKFGVSSGNNDLLEGLMQMKDEEGKQLSETEILDNIVSLVLAGYTSTSLAIMWAFYYLAKYPDVLQKLREPAKAGTHLVFGGGPRICAGNMLARLQIAILLHHLVVGYRWKLVNPKAGMVYLPHPKPADDLVVHITKI
ncbi:hypothetical protein ACJIZ3_003399 [Penstemon smallii]|uniref:Cytochrome P450 n=1 Tax=Penstemon smallii TaxID=265156 RepID=A0ABD3UAQ2_9LAMI